MTRDGFFEHQAHIARERNAAGVRARLREIAQFGWNAHVEDGFFLPLLNVRGFQPRQCCQLILHGNGKCGSGMGVHRSLHRAARQRARVARMVSVM